MIYKRCLINVMGITVDVTDEIRSIKITLKVSWVHNHCKKVLGFHSLVIYRKQAYLVEENVSDRSLWVVILALGTHQIINTPLIIIQTNIKPHTFYMSFNHFSLRFHLSIYYSKWLFVIVICYSHLN